MNVVRGGTTCSPLPLRVSWVCLLYSSFRRQKRSPLLQCVSGLAWAVPWPLPNSLLGNFIFQSTQGLGMACSYSKNIVVPLCLVWTFWITVFIPGLRSWSAASQTLAHSIPTVSSKDQIFKRVGFSQNLFGVWYAEQRRVGEMRILFPLVTDLETLHNKILV